MRKDGRERQSGIAGLVAAVRAATPASPWRLIDFAADRASALLASHLLRVAGARGQALSDSERRLRLVLDSTAEGIYGLDLEGRCILANPSCARMLGYRSPDELLGRKMHQLVHHSHSDGRPYPIDDCQVHRAFWSGARVHVTDEVLWRADGTGFPAEYWSYPILENGRVAGAVVTFLDITERRRAEGERERLLGEQRRARLRAEALVALTTALNAGRAMPEVVKAALTGAAAALGAEDGSVFLFEPDGKRLRGVAELLARDRTNFVADFAHWPNRRRAVESRRTHFFTRADTDGIETEWFDRVGMAGTLVAPLNVDGRCLGLLFLNFASPAYRPTAEELEFAAAVAGQCAIAMDRANAFEEARREAELRERFMAILGHDLRQPLNAITTSASLLLRKRDGMPEGQLRGLERIERGARRMNGMIRDLLDYTRARSARGIPVTPAETDLGEVCRRAVDEVLAGSDGGAELAVEGDCRGHWDADRLAQVVANLLGNAEQYGTAGEPVRVEVDGRGDAVCITVRNHGPPIPPESLPHLFEPFHRGRNGEDGSPDGLGLGLFIVSEIVRAHRGTVQVDSTPQHGTAFRVVLPRAR